MFSRELQANKCYFAHPVWQRCPPKGMPSWVQDCFHLPPLSVRKACISIQLLPVFLGYLLAMHCRAVATCACGIVKFQFTTLDLVTSAASCWHCGSQLHLFRVDTMWPGQIFGRKQRKLNVVTAAAEDEAQIPYKKLCNRVEISIIYESNEILHWISFILSTKYFAYSSNATYFNNTSTNCKFQGICMQIST